MSKSLFVACCGSIVSHGYKVYEDRDSGLLLNLEPNVLSI